MDSYGAYVTHHLIPELGRTRLTKLTPGDVERFMSAMLAGGSSPRSVNHARAVLRKALNDAVRSGVLARNAAALAQGPRVPSVERPVLSPQDARRFIEGVRSNHEGALFVLTLACGLRMGEVTGLRWEDLDLRGETLRVRQALQRGSGEWRLVETKSRASRRTLALPDVAISALQEHRQGQLRERLGAEELWGNDWDLVFTTATGDPLNPSSLTRRFRALLKQIGLPDMRFHDLRHSCASLLIAQGVHARVIMEQLGHSQISLTMNTYGHVVAEVQREAAGQMDALLEAESSTR